MKKTIVKKRNIVVANMIARKQSAGRHKNKAIESKRNICRTKVKYEYEILPSQIKLSNAVHDALLKAIPKLPNYWILSTEDTYALKWNIEDITIIGKVFENGIVELFIRDNNLEYEELVEWKLGEEIPKEIIWVLDKEDM